MLVAALIPRMLGPSVFGNFKFLLFSFSQVTNLIGTGNTYLATELAKNHKNKTLVSFYWSLILAILIIFGLLVAIIVYSNLHVLIFPKQEISLIWVVFFLACAIFLSLVLDNMMDSLGLSRLGSIVNILSKIFSALFLVLFYYSIHDHNLIGVVLYNYILISIIILGFLVILKKNDILSFKFRISISSWYKTYKSYIKFSGPLFTLALLGLPFSFISRWLLQSFGGSIEQGYFSIAESISSFVIIFSNSFNPLLLREFSISHNDKDLTRLTSLFEESISFLFTLSSYFCFFLLLQASNATIFLGGRDFEGATLPVSLMILFTIPYVTNNILYVLIYSTNNTILLRNTSLIFSAIGLVLTFFLVAPMKYFGLNLGAYGFAMSQFICTLGLYLVLLKSCTDIINIQWKKIIGNHLLTIILFVTIGLISKLLVDLIIKNAIISFLASGVVYTVGVVLVTIKFPKIFGSRVVNIYNLIKEKLSYNA